MPTQRSVEVQFWISFRTLSAPSKLFGLYCLTGPQSNFAGLFTLAWDDASDYCQLPRKSITQAISDLSQVQQDGDPFLRCDDDTRLIWVVKRIEHEFPTRKMSEKQAEGMRRRLEVSPRLPMLRDLCNRYTYLHPVFADFATKYLANLPEPHSEPHSEGHSEGHSKPHSNGTDLGFRFSVSGSRIPVSGSHSIGPLSQGVSVAADGFAEFWTAYPRKVGKGKAAEEWRKLHPSQDLVAAILGAIERARRCTQWLRDGGQYIPHPATWLHQRRWEDDPEPEVRPQLTTEKTAGNVAAVQEWLNARQRSTSVRGSHDADVRGVSAKGEPVTRG